MTFLMTTYASCLLSFFDRCGNDNFLFIATLAILFDSKCCMKLRDALTRQTEYKRTTGHALNTFPYVLEVDFLRNSNLCS